MSKFALLILVSFALTGCSTLGQWTSDSMDWADRTFPTYDDWFGDEQPQQQSTQAARNDGYTQPNGYPPEPVQSQPISRNQEIYYDNSERGHSFGR